MIATRSSRDVTRVLNPNAEQNGRLVWNTGYLGQRCGARPAAPDDLFPDAYFVEQGPAVVLPPHFHRENEFQVVLLGDGTFGNEPVRAFSLHYAGAYTPYGPITAGAAGIGYMTLRARYDPGARTMPMALDELRAAGRAPRDFVSDELAVEPAPGAAAPACVTVFAPQPDGLAAWLYTIPPGGTATGPDPRGGGGQFWVVLDGEMHGAGATALPPRSCVFVSADEAAHHAAATTAGPLAVLAVQFPVEP
jgi:hypothetical protein